MEKKKLNHFFTILIFLFFTSAASIFSAVLPANTDIGNQATLKFTNAGGDNEELVSNIVITRVQQVYKVVIVPDRVTKVLSGQEAVFSHTVTNEGNGIDTVLLTHSYPSNYVVKIYLDSNSNGVLESNERSVDITELTNMDLGESRAILVSVKTPIGLTQSVVHNIVVTSEGNANEKDVAKETINFADYADVTSEKSLAPQSGNSDVDRIVTMYIKIFNPSETNSGEVILEDILDGKFEYVSGSGKWYPHGGGSSQGLTDANGGDPVGINYYVETISDLSEGAEDVEDIKKINLTISSIPGNTTGTSGGFLEFKVKVPAGTISGDIENKATFSFNNGISIIPDRETNTVVYKVLEFIDLTLDGDIIEQASAGETITFVNKLVNTGNKAETFNISLAGGNFPAETLASAKLLKLITTPGQIIDDPDADEVVQILESNEITDMIDTNNDGIVDTGVIQPGEVVQVLLQLTLTDDIADGVYTINKIGTSVSNSSVTETAEDRLLTIVEPTVDLTNDFSLSQNPQAPGYGQGPEFSPVTTLSTTAVQDTEEDRTIVYTLFANNISEFATDNYDLSVAGDRYFSTQVLSSVSVIFTDENGVVITNTGDIAPGQSKKIFMKVIPEQYTFARDINIYVRVKSPVTGASDIKYEKLVILPYREIILSPPIQDGVVIPGGRIAYKIYITNKGNIIEAGRNLSPLYFQTSETQSGWSSKLHYDRNRNGVFNDGYDGFIAYPFAARLDPGETEYRFLVVQAPITAQQGDINFTTVTATSPDKYGIPLIINSIQAETRVITEELEIVKFQSLDGLTYTKNLQNASPGEPIYYKIVTTNVGEATATSVYIEDEIPMYTTLANVNGSNTPGNRAVPSYVKIDENGNGANDYNLVETKPAIGKRGTLRANIGELKPNEQAIMYFHVKIDEE